MQSPDKIPAGLDLAWLIYILNHVTDLAPHIEREREALYIPWVGSPDYNRNFAATQETVRAVEDLMSKDNDLKALMIEIDDEVYRLVEEIQGYGDTEAEFQSRVSHCNLFEKQPYCLQAIDQEEEQ